MKVPNKGSTNWQEGVQGRGAKGGTWSWGCEDGRRRGGRPRGVFGRGESGATNHWGTTGLAASGGRIQIHEFEFSDLHAHLPDILIKKMRKECRLCEEGCVHEKYPPSGVGAGGCDVDRK